jgi:hypothetical protein
MVADGRPVAMHDLVHLYADQLSEEHPQADRPEQARDRRAAHHLDITGAAMLRMNPSEHGGVSPQSGSAGAASAWLASWCH